MNTVIVGGGPIGLATAIQAKIINKDLNITILEKDTSYQRTQKLRLDPSSFDGMPKDSDLLEIVSEFKQKKFVPIQEIESKLKALAQKIGIQFETFKVKEDSFGDVLQKYPNAGCIIGADGAHSTVRGKIFNEEFKKNKSVQYLVQVKYEVEQPERIDQKQKILFTSLAGTLVEDNMDSSGEISLRFFVDKKTFEKIKEAKARNPWDINDERVPESLKETIKSWIDARGRANNEEIKKEPTLTGIELKIYSAKETTKEVDGRMYCLVGDAAGGVPFFRSINKGFKESSALAKTLADLGPITPGEQTEEVKSRFKVYQNKTNSIAFWENTAASIKAFFIDVLVFLIRVTKFILPEVLIKWAERKYLFWLERDPYIFPSLNSLRSFRTS